MPEPGRETPLHVTFLGQAFLDAALAELASQQHGVFSLDQLIALGLGASAVRRRVSTGRFHRIHRGVYSLVPKELLKREGLYMAAVLACGPGAVLSHRSAAVATSAARLGPHANRGHRPGAFPPHPPRSSRSSLDDPHRSRHNRRQQHPRDNGRPHPVRPGRTRRPAPARARLRPGRDRRGPRPATRSTTSSPATPLAPAPRRSAACSTNHYIGSTPTENDFEEALLALTRTLGLPDPEVQFWIDPGDGEPPIRADFAWPERRIVVETDGRRTHGTKQAFEGDRRRDQRLIAAGWTVIRTTWRQLKQRPHELRPVLLRLLGPASPNGTAKPASAAAPALARPRRQLAGGSTS